MMKKKWIVFIFIVILLLVFYYIVATLKGIEYKDKIMMCISFTSLFATFGGAYLGAKVSGDNARKLYEFQRDETENKIINKIEFNTNKKMMKVIKHSNNAKESKLLLYVAPEDNRNYDKIMNTVKMEFLELIDGYAFPIIELIKEKEIYENSPQLYQSLLKMFNECNRMNYHINQVDVKDKTGKLPEDFKNLSEEERDYLLNKVHEYREQVRNDILINFVEFEFIESILNDCTTEILNSISEENKLVESIDFKNHVAMRYTLD
ncbi:hypothetical protein [Staphylococcus epidermidis]|uniref:hypothetical protein n=1 Tax=Staphylococcus epidermidis TaxID=1282 RepID=UPI002DBC42E9|nr:hypothetical protein [Staphylococcus epidermidis]MEB5644789.1 hypothetical protein [Staphylococcus epidermidis]MEB6728731.1 hypothetical protein [Staphylococcus epidermidis]